MSRKEFDFSSRKKTEVLYSQLRLNVLDTRRDGSQDLEFVTKELLPSFQNPTEALELLLKFPIEATGDLVVTVGRNFALALKILLGEEDPKIPVETFNDVPSWDKLDADDQLRLRTYSMSKDHLKTRQRGLKEADYLFNVQHYVDEGYTKEQVVEALTPLGLKKWRIEKLYKTAKGQWTQDKLGQARIEVKTLLVAKKPVNYGRIVERVGLPEKYVKILAQPIRQPYKSAKLNALKNKQGNWLKPDVAKEHIDKNLLWYTLSATSQLETSDFPNKAPLSSDVYIQLTQAQLVRAQALVSLWAGALERANTQVQRLGK